MSFAVYTKSFEEVLGMDSHDVFTCLNKAFFVKESLIADVMEKIINLNKNGQDGIYILTSGTTGKPKFIHKSWDYARDLLWRNECNEHDTVINCFDPLSFA